MSKLLSGETHLYPIIGDPIVFVKAPRRLTDKFDESGHNGICVPMQVRAADLEEVMRGLSLVPNVSGLLVTMPHKNSIYPLCATHSPISKLLEVVSIARRNEDGSWHGDMLDGAAFVAAQKKQGAKLQGARVLQIGAGGVGSAIAFALLDAGVEQLILHDTNQARVTHLVDLLGGRARGSVRAGPPDPTGCDMVVNATPLGMAGSDPLPLPVELLTSSMFVGDVIAGHGVTPLLQAAQAAGCRTADGVQMVEAVMEITPDFLLGK